MHAEKAIDALLIYPNPSEDSSVKGTALSIFYVGAAAERAGLKVEYIDQRFDNYKRVEELLAGNPLVVGVSSMTGYQLKGALRVVQYVKEYNPDVKTVLGGVHGSMLPEECISNKLIDFVVVGEGEETFKELVYQIKGEKKYEDVPGIWWKKNGNVMRNEDRAFINTNDWPFPMTNNNKRYFSRAADADAMFFVSSRGCPYKCRFCYNNVFNKRTWRLMPLEKFKHEIGRLHEELKFNYLFLNDDNVGSNSKRLKEMSVFLHSLGIRWGSCIRANDVSEESINVMATNGCDRFLLGVESGSERILKEVIGKDLRNGLVDIRNAVNLIAKTPIKPTYSFMCNIPSETYGELIKSVEFADWIHERDPKARLGFYVYAPYPGTSLFGEAKEQGYKMPAGMHEWSRMSLNHDGNTIAENIYYISGLRFRGDISQIKFPGFHRFKILPFEILGKIRWKMRWFKYYHLEKKFVKRLFRTAMKRI